MLLGATLYHGVSKGRVHPFTQELRKCFSGEDRFGIGLKKWLISTVHHGNKMEKLNGYRLPRFLIARDSTHRRRNQQLARDRGVSLRAAGCHFLLSVELLRVLAHRTLLCVRLCSSRHGNVGLNFRNVCSETHPEPLYNSAVLEQWWGQFWPPSFSISMMLASDSPPSSPRSTPRLRRRDLVPWPLTGSL